MKKMIFCLLALATAQLSIAQVKLPASVPASASSFIKPPAIGDLGKTTTGIVSELTSQLGLGATQKPALTDAVGSFLKEKSGFMDLAGTNPTNYLSKFNPLQKGLFSKLKTIMGAAKFASFLKLKPKGSGAGNVLSNLFF
jgi:hypothetical protein